jgi:hypothetical protein
MLNRAAVRWWEACQASRKRDAIYTYLTAVLDLVSWWTLKFASRYTDCSRRYSISNACLTLPRGQFILSARLVNFPAISIELTDRFAARTRCLLRTGFGGVSRTSKGLMLDGSLYKIAHRNLLESLIVLGGTSRHIGRHGRVDEACPGSCP